jgi:hypothetical protein
MAVLSFCGTEFIKSPEKKMSEHGERETDPAL